MEDRMLSDEILLGIINSKSGGGGGIGDYNKLKNQPQIGGVTLTGNKTASELDLATETALANKADKSAVKNEFLGTLEEWNALTVEQRKAYDTYQIKGDYTEGSGGLPDYSTTEQKTGQKWIDGKDIYRRTWVFEPAITLPSATWVNTTIDTTVIEKVMDMEPVSSGGTIYPLACDKNNNILRLASWRPQYEVIIKYITLYYTKTT